MPRQVVAPTRTAPDAVHFGQWEVQTASGAVPVQEMPSWDYGLELVFTSDVAVDAELASASCGLRLDAGAEFTLVVAAECRDTYWRGTSVTPVTLARHRLTITIPAGAVARSVRLSRRLVVQHPSPDPEPLAPSRGHVVAGADDATTVLLEGEGGRFPTQAVSFRDIGLPDAPWHVSLSYDEPSDVFAGSVQLYLNTDHKAIQQLISPDPDPDIVTDLQMHLSFDIARQLALHAVADERIDSRTEWEDDSVGGVLEVVCKRTSRRSAAGCRAAHAQDPHHFETELKSRLGFMT